MKYTFLFFQIGGDFLSIAQRVKEEGHNIYFYKQKGMVKGREETGAGIFEKEELTNDAWEIINKTSKEELIILLDDNGEGDMADFLRRDGYMVIGGSSYGDKIEYERSLGLDLMEETGLDVPFEKNFTKIDDAVAWLESQEEEARFVFKPEGEEFAGSAKTYTAKNRQDLIDYLTWIKEDCLSKHYTVAKFVLQEFVEGIEADFAGWFNGKEFLKETCLLDIEEKKSGDGNKGEATGCMGNIVINFPESKYFDKYIKPLEAKLAEVGYIGEISINNIFAKAEGNDNKNKEYIAGEPYGIEYTPRMGWDAHLAELAMIKYTGGKVSDFYIALAKHQQYQMPVYLAACGVRVYTGSISLKKDEVAGRYFSFDKEVEPYLWFYSASKTKAGFSIEDNPVLVINTVSESIQEAIDQAYTMLKDNVAVPDAYYRTEIGKRAEEVVSFLTKYGWLGVKKQKVEEDQVDTVQEEEQQAKTLPEQLKEADDETDKVMVLRMAREQMGSKFDSFLREMLREKLITRSTIHLMRTQELLRY